MFRALLLLVIALGAGCRHSAGLPGERPLSHDVRLELRLAEKEPAEGLSKATVVSTGQVIYLHPQNVISKEDIASAFISPEDRCVVILKISPQRPRLLYEVTRSNIGRRLAVVVNEGIVAAPLIQTELPGDTLAFRAETEDAAEELFKRLTDGK